MGNPGRLLVKCVTAPVIIYRWDEAIGKVLEAYSVDLVRLSGDEIELPLCSTILVGP